MDVVATITSLDRVKKGLILVFLLGVTVAVGYKVYGSYQLRLAHKNEQIANELRDQARVAMSQALGFKAQADDLAGKLAKSDAKVSKLQDEISKIKIPPRETVAPANVKLTLEELQAMGLSLVIKPSMTVAPSVAGITADDAAKVWFWGKDALRVPTLELALGKETELAKQLDKSRGVAEKIADTRNKEAESALASSDLHSKEADSLRLAVEETKKALVAERRKKLLYTIGALGLGYVVARH